MRLNRLTQTVACALTPLLSFPLAAQQLPAVTVIGVVPYCLFRLLPNSYLPLRSLVWCLSPKVPLLKRALV